MSVEDLDMEDQAALVEVVNRRIAVARLRELVQEIAEARAEYRRGNVKRGTASDLMRELRPRPRNPKKQLNHRGTEPQRRK